MNAENWPTKVSNAERRALRTAIKSHPRWAGLRKARGITTASLSSSADVLDVCRMLQIDVCAVLSKVPQSEDENAMETALVEAMQDEPAQPPAANPQPMGMIDAVVNAAIDARLAEFKPKAGAGAQSLTVQINNAEPVEVSGMAHRMLDDLIFSAGARDSRGNRQNIMVFGPRSCGKSQAARQVAEAYGLPFYQHGEMTFPHELVGHVNAVTDEYYETPFVKAYRGGGVALLDEGDRWDPQAQTALNGALSDGEIWLPNGECVKRHPDCVVIMTANTRGTGADRQYVGANRLDAAFLDRFAIKLEWTLDLKLEAALLGDDALHKRIKKVRSALVLHEIDVEITTRHAIACRDLMRAGADLERAERLTWRADLTDEQSEMLATALGE